MKIFYKIFVILFLIVSFYILKDDIRSVLENISSHFNNTNSSQAIKYESKEEVKVKGKVDMPGALRVVGNYLNGNDSVKLSKVSIINLTNKARIENGNLPALSENQKLDLSAEKKLQDMFDNQYFEHMSPVGLSVSDLGEEAGYEYILIGENLALGNFKNDSSLIEAWMASPGHRANILNEHYRDIGVAVGKGIYEGKSVWMAVQHFGTPRSICPTVDNVLYGIINLNQNKISEIEANLALRRENIKKGIIYEGSTYYEQIENYNSLVNIYNNLIKETKIKIENYNNQIQTLNLCISSNE